MIEQALVALGDDQPGDRLDHVDGRARRHLLGRIELLEAVERDDADGEHGQEMLGDGHLRAGEGGRIANSASCSTVAMSKNCSSTYQNPLSGKLKVRLLVSHL